MTISRASGWWFKAGIGLVLCLPLLPLTARIATLFMPHRYTSAATISQDALQAAQVEMPPRPETYASAAAGQLGLAEKWSAGQPAKLTDAQVAARLLAMISWHGHPSDDQSREFFTVAATSADPREAADIANAYAAAYLKKWNDGIDQLLATATKPLAAEVESQRKKTDESRAALDTIRTRDKINDPDPELMQTGAYDAERAVLDAKAALDDARLRVDAVQAQITKIDQLPIEDLIAAMPNLKTDDSRVAQLYNAYKSESDQEESLKKSGTGDDDVRIQSLERHRSALKSMMQGSIDSAKKAMQTRADAEKVSIMVPAQKAYDEATAHLQAITTFSSEYIEAKQNYADAKKLLDAATLQYDNKKAALQKEHPPVEILEQAIPAGSASSPDVAGIVVAALRIGFLCALCGGGLFAIRHHAHEAQG